MNKFSRNSDSDEKTWPWLTTLKGPLRSTVVPVPETDATVASQSSYSKVFASGGSYQDVCGELVGVVQDRPAQSPPLILTPSPYFALWRSFRLIVGSEYIARSNATSSNETLTLFSVNFAFCIFLCIWIFMFIQEMKIAEKKIKMNENFSAQTTDG